MRDRLKDSHLFSLPGEYGDVVNSYWLYTIYLKNSNEETRDSIIDRLRDYGIQSRPAFILCTECLPIKNMHYVLPSIIILFLYQMEVSAYHLPPQ